MKIVFAKEHMGHKEGDSIEIVDAQGRYLVMCSVAEYFEENPGRKEEILLQHLETLPENRIDLRDVTFIIPVYYDHLHRKENLLLTVAFLLTYFDTNIIVGEQGGYNFEFLDAYVQFMCFDMEHFHRTKMINEMCIHANTPIVVNWDCDNICDPAQLLESVNVVRNGADISYPFDGTVVRVPRYMFNDVIESLSTADLLKTDCITKGFSSVGHAVVMNKDSFINAGMENENFISWGPEDSERFNRYKMLGLTVHRAAGSMYHMDHYVGENSSAKNPWFQHNNAELARIQKMKKDELIAYIETWPWMNAES